MKNRSICIVTTTRAEYGLLKRLMKQFLTDSFFDTRIVVTGSHLNSAFGMTVREIEEDNIPIDESIPILDDVNDSVGIAKTISNTIISFTRYFTESQPEMVILLGDRYETMAIAFAAVNTGIPIAHLHGGEITEGAVDDYYRNAITKMSYLHFPCTQIYRNRIIQMGENPKQVFNVGSLGTENIMHESLYSVEEMQNILTFNLETKYALVTYHPVTTETGKAKHQINELLRALCYYDTMRFIITKANSDQEGKEINKILEEFVLNHSDQFLLVDSLGMKKYLSLMKSASMVIGNSSSGIIETPVFKIPTVNIGKRQAGRLRMQSILDCDTDCESIVACIEKALDNKFLSEIQKQENIYGDGETSVKIHKIIKVFYEKNMISRLKSFYDLPEIKLGDNE